MTSLSSLLIQFAIVGAIFTALTVRAKKHNNIIWTFLQHFCGVWFIFSGLVKAVDPIGTAYKMEDYFVQFEATFEGLTNVFKGLAPLFPWLSGYGNGFSIFMIVLEIVLGIMLVVGYQRKITAWLFFIIVVFFTFLTGFTYLTGFVPTEANFFDFAKWGPYVKEQMRVTDCGCFGDFIKLDPRISFFKDVGLMVPAIMFLLWSKREHQLFDGRTRRIIVWGSTVATLIFCIYNTYMNLPVVDFRPFKVGTDVRSRKELEGKAKIDILGWVLANANTGEKTTYMEPEPGGYTYIEKYPKKDGWKVEKQIKSDWYVLENGVKTPITRTKINEFAIEKMENGENMEVTEDILKEPGYSLMVIAYHLEGDKQMETVILQDTIWATDTIRVSKDSVNYQRRIAEIKQKSVERETFVPTAEYDQFFRKGVNPVAEACQKAGWKVYAITTYADAEIAPAFAAKVDAKYPFYKGDDKLLKTIIRANPGLVIWKDGKVLDMYHHKHIPTAEGLLGNWK
jgi:uncharacterized membrane protein YphA (DoxX/SURF4 family)